MACDPEFDKFVFNPRLNCYRARGAWRSRMVRVYLNAGTEEEARRALEHARGLWNEQEAWHARVLDCAVAELLDLKNSAWLDDGEAPLDGGQFRARLPLESVTVEPDGRFEFWFDYGDLFEDHAVVVRGSMTDGPADAWLEG